MLDVTGALAGPYCTTILSDLGAEVIKIEPVTGDNMRRRTMGADGKPLPFDLVHRDKASLAVDLKTAEGREIVRKLAQRSDVFVENFRADALRKAGLGYEDLREDCPNLVYCSISGFGQFGPMRDMKGVDLSGDERFGTEYNRFVHREALAEIIQARFATAPRDHWIAALNQAGVPCGPVNDIAAVKKDPHFAERGIFLRDPERHGEPVMVNTPVIADGAPRARGRAPELGQDTASLLAELGYNSARVARLARDGVIGVTAGAKATA